VDLADFFRWGSGPKNIPAEPLKSFPSEEDARFAMANGLSYGTPNAAYLDGNAGRVIGAQENSGTVPLPPARGEEDLRTANLGDFLAASGANYGLAGLLTDKAPSVNATPDSLVPRETRDKISMSMTRAQLAANRIPVAALGLDGHQIRFDASGVPTNIVGAYRPTTDTTYAQLDDGSTLVHEAIHRGLTKLRDQPGFPESSGLHPHMSKSSEEYLVRHIMQHYAGDPEQGPADIQQKNVAAINPPNPSDIQKINDLAAALMAQKRPMGPR
jgi:hypothetical protein